jgi:hypothetical protein
MPINDHDALPGRVEAKASRYDFEREELTRRARDGDDLYGSGGQQVQCGVELRGAVEDDRRPTGISQLHPSVHHGERQVPIRKTGFPLG